ncbi:MAG TPA: type II toxin-antitoxin system VapC family toxin [Polyangiaceae bacterium]
MLGVDTNVLVRVLVGDDPAQHKAAMKRLRAMRRRGEGAFVGPVVLAETGRVLASVYGYERTRIVAALRGVLATPPFVVTPRDAVLAALDAYEKGPANLADYLILELGRTEGCRSLLTFDRRLLKNPTCQSP